MRLSLSYAVSPEKGLPFMTELMSFIKKRGYIPPLPPLLVSPAPGGTYGIVPTVDYDEVYPPGGIKF